MKLLEMKNIRKIYGNGVIANESVDFDLEEGEIHALVGENGAGKSTLMKILFGMQKPDNGDIHLGDKKLVMNSSNDAIANGIGMVHQHFMLVPSFTVAENIVLGSEPKKGMFVDFEKAVKITEEFSKKYNLRVDPRAKVEDLSVGMKQKVEILKALFRGAKILILDEPTAVLTPQETEALFEELINLKNNGHTIIFISHKLKEVKTISDRITVMRQGKNAGVFYTKDVTEQEISRKMVGRDVILKYDKETKEYTESILKVKDLSYTNEIGKKVLKDINFSVRKGEIVGIAGVEGNGQRELIEIITGNRKLAKNNVYVNKKLIKDMTIKQIRNLGLSYIPEDRMTIGAAMEGTIKENLISNQFDKKSINKGLLIDDKKINSLAEKLIQDFRVKCAGAFQKIRMLSGGNMQKVVVARECSTSPQILVAEQPTRGVDVGAARFIHEKLLELRHEDTAILLVSADLNEVLELSDSLIVMYGGEIVAYFDNPSALSEEELGLCMLGLKHQSKEEIRRAMHE
ncbi:ABC transporter ATP-binding protein [Abyssisolibacter fermentans]|uniref:ABC transporter ATP-binding protein n=1 Tax=Abyssisolibacter fermentans TaxID=1766203 RepID=UPI000836CD90|nr:ABC transporter ATP-binding protein [Abyssisolibacter fermentans]